MSRPLFPDDLWVFATDDSPDGPMLVRIRENAPTPEGRAAFGKLVILSWEFDPKANAGLPTSDEIEQMMALEQALFTAFDEDCESGCGVAVMTIPGRRELRFYTPDTDAFVVAFNEAMAGLPAFPIALQAFEDPDWQGFEELQPNPA